MFDSLENVQRELKGESTFSMTLTGDKFYEVLQQSMDFFQADEKICKPPQVVHWLRMSCCAPATVQLLAANIFANTWINGISSRSSLAHGRQHSAAGDVLVDEVIKQLDAKLWQAITQTIEQHNTTTQVLVALLAVLVKVPPTDHTSALLMALSAWAKRPLDPAAPFEECTKCILLLARCWESVPHGDLKLVVEVGTALLKTCHRRSEVDRDVRLATAVHAMDLLSDVLYLHPGACEGLESAGGDLARFACHYISQGDPPAAAAACLLAAQTAVIPSALPLLSTSKLIGVAMDTLCLGMQCTGSDPCSLKTRFNSGALGLWLISSENHHNLRPEAVGVLLGHEQFLLRLHLFCTESSGVTAVSNGLKALRQSGLAAEWTALLEIREQQVQTAEPLPLARSNDSHLNPTQGGNSQAAIKTAGDKRVTGKVGVDRTLPKGASELPHSRLSKGKVGVDRTLPKEASELLRSRRSKSKAEVDRPLSAGNSQLPLSGLSEGGDKPTLLEGMCQRDAGCLQGAEMGRGSPPAAQATPAHQSPPQRVAVHSAGSPEVEETGVDTTASADNQQASDVASADHPSTSTAAQSTRKSQASHRCVKSPVQPAAPARATATAASSSTPAIPDLHALMGGVYGSELGNVAAALEILTAVSATLSSRYPSTSTSSSTQPTHHESLESLTAATAAISSHYPSTSTSTSTQPTDESQAPECTHQCAAHQNDKCANHEGSSSPSAEGTGDVERVTGKVGVDRTTSAAGSSSSSSAGAPAGSEWSSMLEVGALAISELEGVPQGLVDLLKTATAWFEPGELVTAQLLEALRHRRFWQMVGKAAADSIDSVSVQAQSRRLVAAVQRLVPGRAYAPGLSEEVLQEVAGVVRELHQQWPVLSMVCDCCGEHRKGLSNRWLQELPLLQH